MGTRNPVKAAGTPSAPNSQGITSLALAISSATFPEKIGPQVGEEVVRLIVAGALWNVLADARIFVARDAVM